MDSKTNLTRNIVIGLFAGILVGLLLKVIPVGWYSDEVVIDNGLKLLGQIFVILMKMMVVPIVFVSLVNGTATLGDPRKLGRVGIKTILLYLLTTAIAIGLALLIASLFSIGKGANLATASQFSAKAVPSVRETILQLFPKNPIESMAKGKMLQVIIFSLLFGIAIALTGDKAKPVAQFFESANEVLMKLITMIIYAAPFGVFCLIAALFAKMGFDLILHLLGYFVTVMVVLAIQYFICYGALLSLLARLNPLTFFRKIYPAMIFAFSTSSSSVSIPVTLERVENRLGVKKSVAAFVIPLGATINMDGTAIMQGVATVFIANIFNIHLGFSAFLTVIATATLASIGTAGVPGVGLITLAMVLQQVGLPVEGIALILGVDRLLDMFRTAVNIAGDATVACIVGRSEQALDLERFKQ